MFDRALALRLEEMFLAKILLGPEHPEYAMSMYNAAFLYSKLKLPERAVALAESSLAIRQKKLGPRHPHTIQVAEELKLYRKAVKNESLANKLACDQRLCTRCGVMGNDMKVCSACKKVQYCGEHCHKMDWKYHKPNCVPSATTTTLEHGQQKPVLALEAPSCANCKAPDANNRCSACLKVFYCSGDCQKKHWKQHKQECKK